MGARVWDLAIVGSGPAGSAAAIGALSLNPSASVLILDREDFPRDKPCGDAVLDAALAELSAHGVARDRVVGGRVSADSFRITSPRGVEACAPIPCPVTIVPRLELDANLCVAARELGAVWMRRTVRDVRDRRSHVEIDDELMARIVIGADGAESVVRRGLIGARRPDMAVAIRGYGRDSGDPVPTIMLDERVGLTYAWRFPMAGGLANVGYAAPVTGGESTTRSVMLQRMHTLLPDQDVDAATLRAHRLPLSTSGQLLAQGRILLAGDAACLINPISGEGINYAIASGLAAGAAGVRGAAHAAGDYRTAMTRRFGRHQRHVGLLATVIRSSVLVEAGARAASRDRRTFEDVAALGIGEGCLTPRLVVGMTTELLRRAARYPFTPRT